MIAVPAFGCKSHISIDRRFGFIRESTVTSASAADGRSLRRLVSAENAGSEVRADSACRPQRNEIMPIRGKAMPAGRPPQAGSLRSSGACGCPAHPP